MVRDPSTLIQVTVPIPDEVADFMEHVWLLIDMSDDTVTEESGDRIQETNIAPIIGGLWNAKAKQYHFEYWPEGNNGPIWELMLFDNEIEDIGKRHVRELRLWKCPNDGCQNLFTYKADHSCSCPE